MSMNRVHPLPAQIDNCTHIEEGLFSLHRQTEGDENFTCPRIEVRGGTLAGEGIDSFVPRTLSGRMMVWEELPDLQINPHFWTVARRADWLLFQQQFDGDPSQPERPLAERLPACFLAYMQVVQLGQRPVVEPPVAEAVNPNDIQELPPEASLGPPALFNPAPSVTIELPMVPHSEQSGQ